jgi:hypothetical protein
MAPKLPPASLHFVLDFVTYFGADWKKCPPFTSLRTKRKRFTVSQGVDWEFDLKCWWVTDERRPERRVVE